MIQIAVTAIRRSARAGQPGAAGGAGPGEGWCPRAQSSPRSASYSCWCAARGVGARGAGAAIGADGVRAGAAHGGEAGSERGATLLSRAGRVLELLVAAALLHDSSGAARLVNIMGLRVLQLETRCATLHARTRPGTLQARDAPQRAHVVRARACSGVRLTGAPPTQGWSCLFSFALSYLSWQRVRWLPSSSTAR